MLLTCPAFLMTTRLAPGMASGESLDHVARHYAEGSLQVKDEAVLLGDFERPLCGPGWVVREKPGPDYPAVDMSHLTS